MMTLPFWIVAYLVAGTIVLAMIYDGVDDEEHFVPCVVAFWPLVLLVIFLYGVFRGTTAIEEAERRMRENRERKRDDQ